MEIKSVYLKNNMKIGVIGISGKGKSTFLNHLIDESTSSNLAGLIGPRSKENVNSGKTKNPVRYHIRLKQENCVCQVSKIDSENNYVNKSIDTSTATRLAQSNEKCTITINTLPSKEFEAIMKNYDLNELEFIDTQGLLDNIDNMESSIPFEIKECAVLLYLYDDTDQGVRGDYIKRYRNFLNEISDKPLIFLETGTQWQVEELEDIEKAESQLHKKDINYSKTGEQIRERYTILTGNNQYNNKETFLLTSVLSESQSSVNFYEVKLPENMLDQQDKCLRICSAHAIDAVFARLSSIIDNLQDEFKKAKGEYQHSVGFKGCYGLLSDILVYQYQRIDFYTTAKVLRYGRHNIDRFKSALRCFHNGTLYNMNYYKQQLEIHTEYGYHCIYETYENQDILDCMQLMLDLYKYYLQQHISASGTKLSKAIQVYLANSVSSDYMCRDTGYSIPILEEKVFVSCLNKLKDWIGDIPFNSVIYKDYDKFDIEYSNKSTILNSSTSQVGYPKSLITKLDYFCMCLNNEMCDLAYETVSNSTKELVYC